MHRRDKAALSSLDYAMSMIDRMSINHACAQRAYLFLQQLLSYMDASLWVSRDERNFIPPENIGTISEKHRLPRPPRISTPDTLAQEMNLQDSPNFDILALFDTTQGLAENLGSHLESHEAMGSAMWTWMHEGYADEHVIDPTECSPAPSG